MVSCCPTALYLPRGGSNSVIPTAGAELSGPFCTVQVSSEDAARIKALGKEIKAEESSLEELRRKSDGLTQRAAALEQQIEGAGGEKLLKQRALVTKLQEVGCERELVGADWLGSCLAWKGGLQVGTPLPCSWARLSLHNGVCARVG